MQRPKLMTPAQFLDDMEYTRAEVDRLRKHGPCGPDAEAARSLMRDAAEAGVEIVGGERAMEIEVVKRFAIGNVAWRFP